MLHDHVMCEHESLHSQADFLYSHKTGRVLLNINLYFRNWLRSCSDIACMLKHYPRIIEDQKSFFSNSSEE